MMPEGAIPVVNDIPRPFTGTSQEGSKSFTSLDSMLSEEFKSGLINWKSTFGLGNQLKVIDPVPDSFAPACSTSNTPSKTRQEVSASIGEY
jgi:hypothetical protein